MVNDLENYSFWACLLIMMKFLNTFVVVTAAMKSQCRGITCATDVLTAAAAIVQREQKACTSIETENDL